jgi:hypothetical protein
LRFGDAEGEACGSLLRRLIVTVRLYQAGVRSRCGAVIGSGVMRRISARLRMRAGDAVGKCTRIPLREQDARDDLGHSGSDAPGRLFAAGAINTLRIGAL